MFEGNLLGKDQCRVFNNKKNNCWVPQKGRNTLFGRATLSVSRITVIDRIVTAQYCYLWTSCNSKIVTSNTKLWHVNRASRNESTCHLKIRNNLRDFYDRCTNPLLCLTSRSMALITWVGNYIKRPQFVVLRAVNNFNYKLNPNNYNSVRTAQ